MKHACEEMKEITGVDPFQPLPKYDIWYVSRNRVKDLRSKERRKQAAEKVWKLIAFDNENTTREIAAIPIKFCPFCGQGLAPVGTKITAHLAITNVHPFVVSASPQLDDTVKSCNQFNLEHFGMEFNGKPIRRVPVTVEFMVDDAVFDPPSVPVVLGVKK